MAAELIYAFRIMRLPLLDAGGSVIGRIQDIVVIPGASGADPRVLGFVAEIQRRQIFVNAARLVSLDNDGARLRSWDVDLKPFKPRRAEVLIGRDIIDRRIGDETVSDVALRQKGDGRQQWWEPAKVRLARRCVLRRRPSYRLVDFEDVPDLFADVAGAEMAAEAARLRDMHPSRRRRVRAGDAAHPAPPARRGDGGRAARRPARGAAGGRAAAASSTASTSTVSSTCSTRWSTTTSPTSSPRCRASSAARVLEAMDAEEAEVDAPPAVVRGGDRRRH